MYLRYTSNQESHKNDRISLLLVSANPIIDPWVFIILSPPVPRLLWNKICKTAKSKPTQEKVCSIHPVMYQSSPPGDSEGGNFLKVYTGIPGTAGSWSLKLLYLRGKDYGVVAHPCYENNGCRSFGSLDTWTEGYDTWGWKSTCNIMENIKANKIYLLSLFMERKNIFCCTENVYLPGSLLVNIYKNIYRLKWTRTVLPVSTACGMRFSSFVWLHASSVLFSALRCKYMQDWIMS